MILCFPLVYSNKKRNRSDYFIFCRILKGGAESGFRHVKPQEYTPRLLHFHGDRKGIVVKEIPRCKSLLDNTDVYILDLGLKLYQWNGSGSNKDEKMKVCHGIYKTPLTTRIQCSET